jgi:uncharacterized protein YjbJ (UPF0337 family)
LLVANARVTAATVTGDKIIGKIKETAGALVGDPGLELEGDLQQRKAEAEAEAQRLEERAAQRAEVTEVEARQREVELEQQRLATEAAQAARHRQLDAEAAVRKAEADRVTDAELEAVRREEADARAAHERAMQAAAEADRVAEQAKQTADVLDGTRDQMEA